MKLLHAALACFCVGLPPPSGAVAAVPQAPWEPSQAPFVLHGERVVVDRDTHFDGAVVLGGHSALDVAAGHTLTLTGPVASDSAGPTNPDDVGALRSLLKLGEGHLALHADSSRVGSTLLLRGSLGVAASSALGADGNVLTMVSGTRLELADGVVIAQSLRVRQDDPADVSPADWGLVPLTDTGPVTWRVAAGEATLARRIDASAAIVKDGAGTLRLTEFGQNIGGDPLVVREGGLRVDGAWIGSAIHTLPGAVLSGQGYVDQARVAGRLQPGGPGAVGTLAFGEYLHLAPTAQTRIRIDSEGHADALQAWGTMRLDGHLQVEPTPGAWTPKTRWVIAQAEGGFEPADPSISSLAAAGAPDGVSAYAGTDTPAQSRFAHASSTLRYLDPVLTYQPTRVLLGLQFNPRGLNTVDGAWRTALIEDSRFVRESALAHATSGRAWVQTWAANAERPAGQEGGPPPDDRDTVGLQIGISRQIGSPRGAPGVDSVADAGWVPASCGEAAHGDSCVLSQSRHTRWFLSAFAGVQATDLSSRYDPGTVRYSARDNATHIGLGVGGDWRGLRLTAGAAHAWHHARLRRQADPAEADLRSRARAQMTQIWADVRPAQPMHVTGDWGLTPYARLAWLRLTRPGIQESGSLAAVTLQPQTDQRWVSHLGVQFQRQWSAEHGPAVLSVATGIRSHLGSRVLHSPQAYRADPDRPFGAASPPLTRHALQLDIGVHAPVARNVRVGLAYTGQYGARQQQHGVWLGVSVSI